LDQRLEDAKSIDYDESRIQLMIFFIDSEVFKSNSGMLITTMSKILGLVGGFGMRIVFSLWYSTRLEHQLHWPKPLEKKMMERTLINRILFLFILDFSCVIWGRNRH
jgi:hypothetical protein